MLRQLIIFMGLYLISHFNEMQFFSLPCSRLSCNNKNYLQLLSKKEIFLLYFVNILLKGEDFIFRMKVNADLYDEKMEIHHKLLKFANWSQTELIMFLSHGKDIPGTKNVIKKPHFNDEYE